MPRINLLPIRAARRVDTARNEVAVLAVVLVVQLLGIYAWYATTVGAIDDIRDRTRLVRAEIGKLNKVVGRVEEFKAKAETLEKKIEIIEVLKRQKVGPAKLLDDLAVIFTKQPKIWLTRIASSVDDARITLTGGAMGNEEISQLQTALSTESNFFANVSLSYIKASRSGGVKYLEWELTCVARLSAG